MRGGGLKERTATGLLWGALNNLMTQVLSALIGIFLARLLVPADYGMVGMLAIFSAVAGSLQESGFTAALTNLKTVTRRDYNAVFWFSTLMSLTLYVALFFSAPLIARYFRQPELVSLSRLVFGSFVVAGIGTAHAAYMFRNMMNREKAVTGFFALVGSGCVGITLALCGYGYWSLAWQQFTYISLVNVGRLYYVRWLPSMRIDLTPVKKMFGFSSKILVTNIVNQVNNNVLSLIFGRLFPPATLGNYTQAAKWNTMGHSLISGTIQQVAQPVLAEVNGENGDRQKNVFRKLLRFTVFLSMPAMLGLSLVAEEFIVLLLGTRWLGSVTLLRILCVSGAFLPIQTLYQNLFISHGRSDTYMWCTIAQILVQTSVILGFAHWGIVVMVIAYATMLTLWVGVWQVLARRLIGITFREVLKDVLPFLLSAVACVLVAWQVTRPLSEPVVLLVVRILVVAVLYVLVMRLAGAKIFKECMSFLAERLNLKHHWPLSRLRR